MGSASYLSTFAACSQMANEKFDGHFTLLKFTSNWRCCFGTLYSIDPFIADKMAEGKTADEAMAKAMKDPEIFNDDAIYKKLEEEEESEDW